MKRLIGLIWLAGLMCAPLSFAEDGATSGFTILRNATIKEIAPEFTGYVAVRVESATESYWMYIDPTLGADGAKMLLSTAISSKANGETVNIVYWGTASGVKHDFQALNWVSSNRRIHTIYSW
jgi:hypothetical protein